MSEVAEHAIDATEQIEWLKNYRTEMGGTWNDVERWTGIKAGTASNLCGSKGYQGNVQKYADMVWRFRQTLAAQAEITVEAPEIPGYFSTPTSEALWRVLQWGQMRGRIVLGAMGAGLGKTETAKQYRQTNATVFHATMSPSKAGVMNMQLEVLRRLGERNAVGSPQKLSQMIETRFEDMETPLLILDEAQHLSEKALEEIRSWHDATGVGIALLGNEIVQQRLDGGSRKATFAQLFSRVGMKLIRPVALEGDADALANAWKVTDPDMIGFIRRVVALPGALRGASRMLELGSMIAASQSKPLNREHLEGAWRQLSSPSVMA